MFDKLKNLFKRDKRFLVAALKWKVRLVSDDFCGGDLDIEGYWQMFSTKDGKKRYFSTTRSVPGYGMVHIPRYSDILLWKNGGPIPQGAITMTKLEEDKE